MKPVLILGVGGLVAIVLISMYLPMFRLGGVIGRVELNVKLKNLQAYENGF